MILSMEKRNNIWEHQQKERIQRNGLSRENRVLKSISGSTVHSCSYNIQISYTFSISVSVSFSLHCRIVGRGFYLVTMCSLEKIISYRFSTHTNRFGYIKSFPLIFTKKCKTNINISQTIKRVEHMEHSLKYLQKIDFTQGTFHRICIYWDR